MQSPYASILLIAVLVLLMYFVVLRPQRKRQQAQQQTLRTMEPGVRVMTTSGIYATVVHVGEKQMVIETGPGNRLTVLKQAVAKVVPDGEEDSADYGQPTDQLTGPEASTAGADAISGQPVWPPAADAGSHAGASAAGSIPPASNQGESVWSQGTEQSSAPTYPEDPTLSTGASGTAASGYGDTDERQSVDRDSSVFGDGSLAADTHPRGTDSADGTKRD